jgi:hypothetical protein
MARSLSEIETAEKAETAQFPAMLLYCANVYNGICELSGFFEGRPSDKES